MKKVSLMLAFVGIISASAFANGIHVTTNPQDGSKAQKTQAAPTKKHHAAKKDAVPKTQAKPVVAKEQKKK